MTSATCRLFLSCIIMWPLPLMPMSGRLIQSTVPPAALIAFAYSVLIFLNVDQRGFVRLLRFRVSIEDAMDHVVEFIEASLWHGTLEASAAILARHHEVGARHAPDLGLDGGTHLLTIEQPGHAEPHDQHGDAEQRSQCQSKASQSFGHV